MKLAPDVELSMSNSHPNLGMPNCLQPQLRSDPLPSVDDRGSPTKRAVAILFLFALQPTATRVEWSQRKTFHVRL